MVQVNSLHPTTMVLSPTHYEHGLQLRCPTHALLASSGGVEGVHNRIVLGLRMLLLLLER